MPHDPVLAQLLRDDLVDVHVTEVKMFGGVAFLSGGHMICGVHKGGAMFRVGKDHYDAALAVPGASPMMFTTRPMAGMVDCNDDACTDDDRRGTLLAMALKTVRALPPKMAKRPKG